MSLEKLFAGLSSIVRAYIVGKTTVNLLATDPWLWPVAEGAVFAAWKNLLTGLENLISRVYLEMIFVLMEKRLIGQRKHIISLDL